MFLIIVLRTGVNTTPLLEAPRDCLAPNPLMPNMMIMNTFKRRGKGHQRHVLRTARNDFETSVIPMDGVAILNGVLTRTAPLIEAVPEKLRNHLWLYRSTSRQNRDVICALSESHLRIRIRVFVDRHQLRDDHGQTLIPAPQRLRKTMEARLWGLSNGDLAAVAAAVGHTPEVADQHYLRLTEDMKTAAAQFVGLALSETLRGNGDAQVSMPWSITTTIQNTPVGRCANALHGRRAPRNGVDPCDRFTECMTCPTFVVVGTVKDLHRLFSFQRFLLAEIEYTRAPDQDDWHDHRRKLIELIDRFTAVKFPGLVVSEAKSLAMKNPHPFWAVRMKAVETNNGERRHG
jgi:hypothetical protein